MVERARLAGRDVRVQKWYRALSDFEVHDAHPLVLSKGEIVKRRGKDRFDGKWVWVENEQGKEGWLPSDFFEPVEGKEEVCLREAFNGRELSFRKGEWVVGTRAVGDWIWCRRENGEEGWAPGFMLLRCDPCED